MSEGRLPADEVTLTIRPQPCSAILGANARIRRIEAITCRSHCACQSSSVSSSSGLAKLVPALLTRMSGAPPSRCGDPLGRVERGHVDPVGARDGQHARALLLEHAHGRRADAAARAGHDRACGPSVPGPCVHHAGMTAHTVYRTFNTDRRREFVRITDDVAEAVAESGIREGMVLVSAMHITAGVWINDDEPGILEDTLEWLDKLAPPSWKEPANEVARGTGPRPGRLPPPPRRRGQRRRPLEEPARPSPGGGPGDGRQARPRPVAGDLLRRVRRRPRQAARHQGARRVVSSAAPRSSPGPCRRRRTWSRGRSSRRACRGR